jgi:hypothetical protein
MMIPRLNAAVLCVLGPLTCVATELWLVLGDGPRR